MKKLVLSLVLGIISVGAVSAQATQKLKAKSDTDQNAKVKTEVKKEGKPEHRKRTPEERADLQAKRLQTHYNLTDAQTAKIREMSLAKATQMEAIKAKYADNRKNMGAEMKTVRNNYDNQLKSVLSPEQFAQFEKDRAEKMAKHKENRGKHKGHYKGKMKSKSADGNSKVKLEN